MFETGAELQTLQELLDSSFERVGGELAGFDQDNRMSAKQLAGFNGVKLVSVASINSKMQPRVAPRSAAFLHGKFYLAADSRSTTVRRLRAHPDTAIAYYENHLLVMAHGAVSFLGRDEPSFSELGKEWMQAFRGGRDSLKGVDLFLVIEATHLVAFAANPDRYPVAWSKPTTK
jgi:nitroimidazol reductase NimA-like FMN-containing flavoprotein (pyridoxamine 5'-phosphate oxidase superfamily)